MYKRFVVDHVNRQSGVNQGILGAAYRLSREEKLNGSAKLELDSHLEWLEDAFVTPEIFDKPENLKGVCWFKNSQVEIIDCVRTIVPLVEECGLAVTELTSASPGNIIYEDEFQIVAIPE
ncbi:hypothetical protein VV869_18470 [Photobacterium sp. MCCC 1A19761]|uniref:hypothetical protein n=1 Tax=Photobacterium sp. MCCC 1A19761 TaxID=3115000 RepID=UPI00307DAB69